ncbi:Metallo-dependent phosphatase [Aspergillus campestris IBT 28561]|uniref:Metallo-dependent phosphatase n=1 Tax=Aspergillus campestris (strain IBT 28561) TaxID=1392248 RepID=A0A2I1CRV6_ASPC2|nr:Metallo-dependent phosphatase [Aspergillus campestris IBT 28561]PKY00345.1 Metallo-dependent phosphatase [Aspergillus campestris IBT 28561]
MSVFGKQSTTPLDAFLNRPRPSAWQQFLSQPCVFLARKVYTWQQITPAQPLTNPVSVVCISDTHNSQPALPDGDILIHAGDLTQSGSPKELQATVDWLHAQPHPIKIVIAGNHDLCLDASFTHGSDHASLTGTSKPPGEPINWRDIIYLQDTETTVTCNNGRRLRIYGSPHSPRHGNWAFQYPRSQDIWTGKVPGDLDILVTHGPPRAHLDLLNLGCVHLLRELWRVRPRLHVFGHVHEGAGTEWLQFNALQDVYERTVVSKGGAWNLVQVIKAFVQAVFSPIIEAKCLLVNPAIVGGLRDDERRRPVKVII